MTPTTSTPPVAPGAVGTKPDPTHGCARCGAPVAMGVGLCEDCNPLGLRDVSASQVHGTVIIMVLVGFVVLAIAARLAVTGLGPFPATLVSAVPVGDGLAITLTVTNEGSATGQTTCRVTDPAARGGASGAFLLSPPIDPGTTVTFTQTVAAMGSTARAFDVECRTP
jgi:hypothetical protein